LAENISRMQRSDKQGPAFLNYSFLSEMKSDGIENCFQYIDNFDPEKSKNPFSYFSQIIYYAFLRRIAKEKKELYIKYKTAINHGIFDAVTSPESSSEFSSFEVFDNLVEYVQDYEKKLAIKKTKMQEDKNAKPKILKRNLETITNLNSVPSGNNHSKAQLYDIMLPNNYMVLVSTGESKVFCKAHNINWRVLLKEKKTKGYSLINIKPLEESANV